MPDPIAPVQVANTSSPPPQSAVGGAPPSPALNPDEQAGAADLSTMTPDERAGFNDTVQAGIAQSRMNPDEAAGAQDLQAQVDTITKTGKAGDIANFYKDRADVLSSGQTRALGDAYLRPSGKSDISDVWNNTVGMFKQLYHFVGVTSGATTAGEFAGNLTAGESAPQAQKNAFLQTGAEAAHGTEALEMQFLQLGKSIVTLGMRAVYQGMKPSLTAPKGGKVPENIEANPANPSTFFQARNGTEEMMDAAGIMAQNEKILQGEGFYSQPGSVFAKDTLAKQGITVDPEVSNAVATGGFVGLTSMLSGLRIAGAAAAPTAGRVFIVNEAGDIVAKAATREAATDFIQGTAQWVGEGMSKVGSSLSGAMNKVIGATLAGPKKLLEKVTSRFGEGVAGPAVTLAGEHALDMIPHVKTVGLIAGGVAAGLKATGAGLKLGGNILASEPVSTAVAGTVKGAVKGTVAGAPYAAAGNENDPQAMLTQALTFGVLGGAAGAIHGTAAGISRMSQIAHGEILPKVQPLPNTRVTGNTPNLTKFEDAHQQTMEKLDQFNPLRAALTNAQKDLLQKQGHSWYVFTRQQADSFGLPDAAGEHDAPVTGDDGKPTTINYSVMDNDEVAAGDHEPGHIVADFAQKALPDLWKSLMAAVPGDVRAKLESAYKAASAGNPDIEAAMKTPGYFDKEIGAEILGKYLSDNLRGITDKAPTLASRLNNLVGHVFDKLGISGNQVGSAAEGATQGFGMVPGMDAAKIAKNIVTKFKTDKQVGTVLEPTKPETPPAPAPAESKFVTPQHEAVVQGLADAVGEKNKSVIKLRGIMEKLRKGESLTPEEADLWKGIHATAVKAGAPDVTAPVETEAPTETPAKPKEPEAPAAPESPTAPKNLRVEPEDIKAFSNPAREEANQTLESVNKQVQASPDYTPEQKEAMASFAANPGVMHETAGLSLEPGEKGIADTLRRVAQQNGLDWTKLLVGRNIAPKLARMSERSGAQVQAWSGDRAARNLAQVTGILADAIKAGKLKASDFPWLKPDGTVDPEQMRQGLIQYLKNQDAGARGGGEPLIRPVKGAEKVPAVNPEGEVEPLDADPAKNAAMEKVFNLAMGEKPPKTGRVTEGVEPVQIRAKAIANVNKNAGTLIQPAKTPKQVDVYEYNSLRNKLNKAGVNINQLEPVNTWHNLKDLKGAKATPDIALKPSVQDTTAAGFMPKKPIEITGPDGTKYKAMFDGYQDFTNIGMGRLPQITVKDEAPGFTKNTTTYGPTLEKAGYTLPELPKQELTNGSFMPNKHPMAVKEAAVQNKKTGKIYTGAYHAEANLKYLEETNPGDPSNAARAWGMVENPDSGMIDGFKTNAGEFLNRNQAFDRAVQMGQYVPREAWESARAGLEAVSFNKQQGREGISEGSRPGHYNPEASYLPRKSYAEAQKDEGNPYVRKSATPEADANPSNKGRSLMVQFSSDLLYKGQKQDTVPSAYYDKLYSGARKGYARMADFWEIPQWVGFVSKFAKNADMYVVRDMDQAKAFLKQSGYDRMLFSSLDVNRALIKELAESDGAPHADVGGYTDSKFFDGTKNLKWHPNMESLAKDIGVPYEKGVDYRHFQGADVIPRLTLSSGCLHKCAFCTIEKQVVEMPKAVIEQQADEVGKMGSKLVYLNDKTFGQAPNYKALPELFDRIKKQNPGFKGFIVQTTASQMVKFTPEYLKSSGIRFVELGIESYNNPILKAMHKPATESLMDRAADACRKNGIALIPNIMIGLPGETAETYAHTMGFLKSNSDIISHANIYNLAIYKNTDLGKQLTTASPDDYNENVLEKSFHTDPKVHQVFAGDLYGYATHLLEQNPDVTQYLPNMAKDRAKADGIKPISAVPGYMPNTPQKETTGWILPDHTWTPTSAGPMGHAENLAHNAPAYTEAFGAGLSGNVNDAERLNAVNKGFVRFRNYAGDLTIETNERHWENQKASVLQRLLDNQDDLHRVDIRIVTDDGKFLSGKGRTLSESQNKEEALKDLVNEVKIPQGTPISSEPTLIQRARALPGLEGTPAFMPPRRFWMDSEGKIVPVKVGEEHPDTAGRILGMEVPSMEEVDEMGRDDQRREVQDEMYSSGGIRGVMIGNKLYLDGNENSILDMPAAQQRAIQKIHDKNGVQIIYNRGSVNEGLEPTAIQRARALPGEEGTLAFMPNKSDVGKQIESAKFSTDKNHSWDSGDCLTFAKGLSDYLTTRKIPHDFAVAVGGSGDNFDGHVYVRAYSPGDTWKEGNYLDFDGSHDRTDVLMDTARKAQDSTEPETWNFKSLSELQKELPKYGLRFIIDNGLAKKVTARLSGHVIAHEKDIEGKFDAAHGYMPKRKQQGNLDQKDLYIIRHGSTPANEAGLTRGWSKVPLSAEGKREANEAGIQLGGHGLDRIVTSDLNRAQQTANIISEHTGAPVEVNPGLRSWGFGPKLENKPVEEVHKLLHKLVNNPDTRPEGEYPDGTKPETFNEYKHRIFSTVEGIQNKYPEGKTAIVTHYRTMRALEARTKGHEIDVPKFLEKGTDNPAEIKYLKNGKLTTKLPEPSFMPRVKNPKAKPPELSEFDDEKKIKAAFEKPNWAIVTGTRESDGPANSEKNQRANDRLEGELFGSGLDYRVIQGSYKGVDQGKSFLITGITPAESLKLGREYGQESVLVPQGLLYNDGTLNPIDSAKNKFGADAEKEDFYSKTEAGPVFSAGINFDKRIPTDLGTVNREQAEMFGKSSPKIGSEVVRAKGDKTVPYDFEGGPNLKAEKTPGDKVAAMADKIVAEVHAKENTPEFRDGLTWYSDFVPKLKNWFGEHSHIFAELLAATSPQTSVTVNFGYAVKAYEGWLRGEYSDQLTKLNEGLSKVDDGSIKSWYKKVTPKETQIEDPTPSQYIGAWIDEHKLVPTQWGRETVNPITGKETPKEVKFGLHGRRVLKVLARKWLDENPGQKVANFVKNLTGEGHDATIDVWAARLLRRLAYDTGKKPWRIAPAQEGAVNKPDFDFGQAAFRRAGKTLGIKPDALQAALWFAEKKLWAQNRWSKTLDLGDFRNELENFITRRKYQKAQGKLFGNEVVPLNKVQSKKGLGAEAIKAMPETTRELFDIHPKK